MQLGELAADRRFAFAEPSCEIGERRGEPRTGLEHNDRSRDTGQFGDTAAARSLFGRQEAGEEKLVRRQA